MSTSFHTDCGERENTVLHFEMGMNKEMQFRRNGKHNEVETVPF